jgi:hypothetical protein
MPKLFLGLLLALLYYLPVQLFQLPDLHFLLFDFGQKLRPLLLKKADLFLQFDGFFNFVLDFSADFLVVNEVSFTDFAILFKFVLEDEVLFE